MYEIQSCQGMFFAMIMMPTLRGAAWDEATEQQHMLDEATRESRDHSVLSSL